MVKGEKIIPELQWRQEKSSMTCNVVVQCVFPIYLVVSLTTYVLLPLLVNLKIPFACKDFPTKEFILLPSKNILPMTSWQILPYPWQGTKTLLWDLLLSSKCMKYLDCSLKGYSSRTIYSVSLLMCILCVVLRENKGQVSGLKVPTTSEFLQFSICNVTLQLASVFSNWFVLRRWEQVDIDHLNKIDSVEIVFMKTFLLITSFPLDTRPLGYC